MGDVEREVVYKNHRIHAAYLFGGGWVVSVLHTEGKGSGVEAVSGEYQTYEDAVSAAERYIEQKGGQQALG